nr:beta-lactamase family protein [Chloroflexia bacterium]
LPQFAFKPPVFAPGESVRYNNCAFVLLGLVIERATGVSYRDYVTEHIFRRAGMHGADFCAMDGICSDLAEHYKRITQNDGTLEWRKNVYSYPPIGSPDGGATVTALDLDMFYRAITNYALVGEDAATLLLTPQVFVKERDGVRVMNGFGFEFRVGSDDRVVAIEKEGQNAGVAANFAHYPDRDITFVLLANQDCDVWTIVREVEPLLLAG